MPGANRHFLPGQLWYICGFKLFVLAFLAVQFGLRASVFLGALAADFQKAKRLMPPSTGVTVPVM